jgi:hypothetical protein
MKYLQYFLDRGHYHMFPPLVHFATHVVEDVARYGCGAGHISAYPFENQLSVFGKVSALPDLAFLYNLTSSQPTLQVLTK